MGSCRKEDSRQSLNIGTLATSDPGNRHVSAVARPLSCRAFVAHNKQPRGGCASPHLRFAIPRGERAPGSDGSRAMSLAPALTDEKHVGSNPLDISSQLTGLRLTQRRKSPTQLFLTYAVILADLDRRNSAVDEHDAMLEWNGIRFLPTNSFRAWPKVQPLPHLILSIIFFFKRCFSLLPLLPPVFGFTGNGIGLWATAKASCFFFFFSVQCFID